jgi:hypothetical protein
VFRIIALVMFILSVIFDAWSIKHGIWDYILFALLGLVFWCASTIHDYAWPARPAP